jgi:hypothetical protein
MLFLSRMRVLWRMSLKWLDWKPWYVPLYLLLLNLIKKKTRHYLWLYTLCFAFLRRVGRQGIHHLVGCAEETIGVLMLMAKQ